MAGCFTPGGNDCHYPVEDNKEKDCNNPSRCSREGGGCNRDTQYPGRDRIEVGQAGRDRVEVDREGIDLYFSVRLKPINIILTILTIGIAIIATLMVKRYV